MANCISSKTSNRRRHHDNRPTGHPLCKGPNPQHIGPSKPAVVAESGLDNNVRTCLHGLKRFVYGLLIITKIPEAHDGKVTGPQVLNIGVFMCDAALLQDLRIRGIPGRGGAFPVRHVQVENCEVTAGKVIAQITRRQPDARRILLHDQGSLRLHTL